jgi:L-2-hydroxyglutarate oxidase
MWRSNNKGAFVKALQKLIPEIEANHLTCAPAGIRAQAVSPAGALVDDFLIEDNERIINVCNAPSPAATASINIGKTILAKLANRI